MLFMFLVLLKWMVNNDSDSGKSKLSTMLFRLYGVYLEDKEYCIRIVTHLDD